jgi:hypothetical protein
MLSARYFQSDQPTDRPTADSLSYYSSLTILKTKNEHCYDTVPTIISRLVPFLTNFICSNITHLQYNKQNYATLFKNNNQSIKLNFNSVPHSVRFKTMRVKQVHCGFTITTTAMAVDEEDLTNSTRPAPPTAAFECCCYHKRLIIVWTTTTTTRS